MKISRALSILIFSVLSCSDKLKPQDEISIAKKSENNEDKVFTHASYFPIIKDTSVFIADLRKTFSLEVEDPYSKKQEITTFQKVKIYSSSQDYIFIEYDYKSGSNAAFPWKYQLLLTTEGKLVNKASALRFEFIVF
jgi:hypothetical protein